MDGIESVKDVMARCNQFLNALVEQADCNQTVFAFSHASTIIQMMRYIKTQTACFLTVEVCDTFNVCINSRYVFKSKRRIFVQDLILSQ